MLLEEALVGLNPNHRSAVAGNGDDGAGAEYGVDGAALEPEFAQVRARQERSRTREEVGAGAPVTLHLLLRDADSPLSSPLERAREIGETLDVVNVDCDCVRGVEVALRWFGVSGRHIATLVY